MMSASGGVTLKDNLTGVQVSEDSQQKVKVSSIPLYPAPEEYEYYVDPPSKTENIVKDVRISVEKVKSDCQPFLDKVSHIYNTGIAHTNESIISLRDEDHLLARIGFMTAGGVIGLLSARRGRFLKRVAYTSIGIGGFGAVCYPQKAENLAASGFDYTKKNARIAYHFIIGSRPQVQNEDGQALKSISNMAGDIGQWSVNLLKKLKPAPSADKATDESIIPETSVDKTLPKTEDSTSKETSIESSSEPIPQLEEPTSPIIQEAVVEESTIIVTETKEPETVTEVVEAVPEVIETEEVKPETVTEAASVVVETEELKPETVTEAASEVVETEEVKPETVTEAVVEAVAIVVETEEVKPETVTEAVVESAPVVVEAEEIKPETVAETIAEAVVEAVVEAVSEAVPVVIEIEELKPETIAEVVEVAPMISEIEEVKPEAVSEVVEDAPIISVTEEAKPETATEVVDEATTEAVEKVSKVEAEEVKPVIEGDFGQGYAEDKMMYTTRD